MEVTLAANALNAAMQQAEVKLLAIRSEAVFEQEFNRLTQVGGKGGMLFDVTSRLLMHLWQTAGEERIVVRSAAPRSTLLRIARTGSCRWRWPP
jgi:hypothetical protein